MDAYVAVSNGRSLFRVEDLLALCQLVKRLDSGHDAADV